MAQWSDSRQLLQLLQLQRFLVQLVPLHIVSYLLAGSSWAILCAPVERGRDRLSERDRDRGRTPPDAALLKPLRHVTYDS